MSIQSISSSMPLPMRPAHAARGHQEPSRPEMIHSPSVQAKAPQAATRAAATSASSAPAHAAAPPPSTAATLKSSAGKQAQPPVPFMPQHDQAAHDRRMAMHRAEQAARANASNNNDVVDQLNEKMTQYLEANGLEAAITPADDPPVETDQLTLAGLMAAWGQSNSPYDLSGDGTVGVSDMLILLQAGGTMPMPEGSSEELSLDGLLGAWGTSNSTFDLNGDGTVDVSDLLILLEKLGQSNSPQEPQPPADEPAGLTMQGLMAAWGQSNSPYDLNGDGTVDVSDMLMLLNAGGSMPMPEGATEPLTLSGLLGAWGSNNPTFDLNGDGVVDTSDMLMLLAKMSAGEATAGQPAASDLPSGMTAESLLSMVAAEPNVNAQTLADLKSLFDKRERA